MFGQQRVAKHGSCHDKRGTPSVLVSSHSLPISILTAFPALLPSKTFLLALLAVLIQPSAHTLRGASPDLDPWTSPCQGMELKHQHWVCSSHVGAFHWCYFRISVPQPTLPHQFVVFLSIIHRYVLVAVATKGCWQGSSFPLCFPSLLEQWFWGSPQSNLNPCRYGKDPADCAVL